MHVRPLLDYASQIWNLGYSCDLKLLEGLQRRWTRVISAMENVSYTDSLKPLDLFSLQGSLLRADMILLWKIFQGLSPIKLNMLFQAAPLTSTRGHPFKIFLPQARLEVRKIFFSIGTIHCCNGLSCDTICADSLNRFKAGSLEDSHFRECTVPRVGYLLRGLAWRADVDWRCRCARRGRQRCDQGCDLP